MSTAGAGWTVLVPVRDFATGKSRLRRTLAEAGSDWDPTGLSRSFAADVLLALAAAAEVDRVIVVADRPVDAGTCELWVQPPELDLNRALEWAVSQVGDGSRCVVVMADLPCLDPGELDRFLTTVDTDEGFVRDAEGSGTSMLIATGSTVLQFGVGSASAHAAALPELTRWAGPTLRQDVDDYQDLLAALALGVGPRTAASTA